MSVSLSIAEAYIGKAVVSSGRLHLSRLLLGVIGNGLWATVELAALLRTLMVTTLFHTSFDLFMKSL